MCENVKYSDEEKELFATADSPEWYDENEHARRRYSQPSPEINEFVYSTVQEDEKKKKEEREISSDGNISSKEKNNIIKPEPVSRDAQEEESENPVKKCEPAENKESVRIMQGAFGDEVRKIQEYLRCIPKKAGGTPELEPDGIYGLKTARAVMQFQAAEGKAPDGVVDGATYDAMKAAIK